MTRTQLIGAITDLLVAGQKRTALQLRNLLIDIVNNVLCPDDNGNVGIGTSSPGARLAIYDPSTCTLNITEGVGGTTAQLTQTSYGDTVLSNYANARSLFLQQVGLGNIVFITNNSEKMRIDASGNVGIGTTSPTEKLDIDSNAIRLRTAKTPASATATGTQGQVCWDSNYVYVCVATNTWKRSAISTW